MKVVVFGATGKTGQHVLSAALAQGHRVTAFGRSIERIEIDDPALKTHAGDVFDAGAVAAAVAGHDAAIVCLGSANLRDATTLSTGTRIVIDALVTHDVNRLIVMSATGVGESRRQVPWTVRLLSRTLLRNASADHRAQEALVEQSPLDWTIVRAGVLKDDPGTGHYTATNSGPITKITRADAAAALVDQLDDTAYRRAAISVTEVIGSS